MVYVAGWDGVGGFVGVDCGEGGEDAYAADVEELGVVSMVVVLEVWRGVRTMTFGGLELAMVSWRGTF